MTNYYVILLEKTIKKCCNLEKTVLEWGRKEERKAPAELDATRRGPQTKGGAAPMARNPTIRTPTEKVATSGATAVCSGCSGNYPHRELIELHEDNHDNLTFFHGDRLCRSCADDAGIGYFM